MEVKELIEKAGFSQVSFAKKIEKSTGYINQICAGKRKPPKCMVLLLEKIIENKILENKILEIIKS